MVVPVPGHNLPQELGETDHHYHAYQYWEKHIMKHDRKDPQGAFHPEYGGSGATAPVIEPSMLTKRSDGKRMACGVVPHSVKFGCGGGLLPQDTVPLPALGGPTYRSSRPWTRTAVMTNSGLFSRYAYRSCPDADKSKPRHEPPFHTGKGSGELLGRYQHIPDDAVEPPRKTPFRLKCGKVPNRLDPRLKFEPGSNDRSPQTAPAAEHETVVRHPFIPYRNLQGTFAAFPTHVPDEYRSRGALSGPGSTAMIRRPIFTWWSHTKRNMPVMVPWTTGLSTVEARPSESLDLGVH
jgi:hypothetical protein